MKTFYTISLHARVLILLVGSVYLLTGCNTTSNLPPDEVLYMGIQKIQYIERDVHTRQDTMGVIKAIGTTVNKIDAQIQKAKKLDFSLDSATLNFDAKRQKAQAKRDAQAKTIVKEEVGAVLAFAPNGSIFGSSTLRSPWTPRLWIYNAFARDTVGLGKWLRNTFGSKPIYISTVNPAIRTRIATNTLHNNGYFQGRVTYRQLPPDSIRKAHISYDIKLGPVYRYENIRYLGFPMRQDSLIRATLQQTFLHPYDAFNAYRLTQEQARLEELFRENGYFFYKKSHTTYEADTVRRQGWVQLRVKPASSHDAKAMRQWTMGRTKIYVLRHDQDQITDSMTFARRKTTYYYSGGKMPLRAFLWRQGLLQHPGDLYKYSNDRLSLEKLKNLNVFSALDMEYTPRDTIGSDTLDLRVYAVMDKAYDGAFEMYTKLKSNRQLGPGLAFSLAKRNAFRGGETVAFKVFGSYEWQLGNQPTGKPKTSLLNSYELGATLSFDFPRFMLPYLIRKTRRYPASTVFALSLDWLKRSNYYAMLNWGLDATYKWHKRTTSQHELTLFSLEYYRLLSRTDVFDSIMSENPALYISMSDQFVPSISYTYTGSSRPEARHKRYFQFSIKEAGNLTSGLYRLAGHSFTAPDKKILHTPFAQFIKATAEFRENFKLSSKLHLATRLFVGTVYSYGNSHIAPYSEQFYVGGANSVRAFAPRTIGPGSYRSDDSRYAYIDQTGDFKFEVNAELRFPVFGQLAGAVFVDAGNVWLLRGDGYRDEGTLNAHHLKDIAVGTGLGVRYDIDFLILRLDLGIGLHAPYATSRRTWYNMEHFSKSLMLNFAIGYPF